MKIHKLLENIESAKIFNEEDIEITGIAYDSRDVKPGDLFVAIKGYKTHGDKYIPEAIKNGAVGVVVEDYLSEYHILQVQVDDTRKVLAKLANNFYDNPSKDLKIIGITGTNGKTSTTFMANSILEKNNFNIGSIGTVYVKYGDYVEPSILTTPESLDLQRHFYNMGKQDVSHVMMEVSSSALKLNRVDNTDFDLVILNNISREHLDLHDDFEEYFETKSSLIKNLKKDGWAILNLDCPYSSSLVDKTEGNVLTFGIDNKDGDIYIKDLDLSSGIGNYTFVIQNQIEVGETIFEPQSFNIELSVAGYHSVYNSIVAIGIGLLLEIPVKTIQEGIKEFKGVERRCEFIYDDDFTIVDDHFANTGNIDATMKTLSLMDVKNHTMVYAIRGSRGVSTNRENGLAIAKWADKLGMDKIIATSSVSHVMDKDIVLDEEYDVFMEVMDQAGIEIEFHKELPDAISSGLSKTSEGDILLLAGCQGMDYGAEIVLNQLYRLKPELDKDQLFKPMIGRVAGNSEFKNKEG